MFKSGWALAWGVVAVLLAAAVGVFIALRHRPPEPPVIASMTTAPATKPAVDPAKTQPAKPAEPAPVAYIDVVRANLPTYPATQPLVLPVDLPQAAHLVLHEPVYIDSQHLNLWLTHRSAPPTADVLRKSEGETEFVVPERVLFVHWAPNEKDIETPRVVTPRSDGGFDYVSAVRRVRIPPSHEYQWDRARAWGDKIIVPSRTGVSAFRFTPEAVEAYQDLMDPHGGGSGKETGPSTAPAASATGPSTAPSTAPTTGPSAGNASPFPQILWSSEGYLAWIPWERGQPGGRGAARFVNDHWEVLDSTTAGWPDRLLHLIPLLGGSVMQLAVEGSDRVRLGVAGLDSGEIDREEIRRLVLTLSSASPKTRDEAFEKLTRYGPGIRPILKELLETQPPEAQIRLRQLLRDQVQPLLGPMSLLGDKLQLVTRHRDGGVVLYAESGVSIANPDGDPSNRVPAWLAIRPGRAVYILPEVLVADANPATAQLIAVDGHDDDWIAVTDASGPRRFVGNALVNLLHKDEAAYSRLVGVDRRGRWLFRKPGDESQTLLLDPTLPDATPRLPVWNYTNAEEVGWDKENWPAVRQVGLVSRLKETGWEPLDKEADLLTRPDQIPPATTQPMGVATAATGTGTTLPATAPSTLPATTAPSATTGRATESAKRQAAAEGGSTSRASTQPTSESDAEAPILTTADGTRYYGGITDLRVVAPWGARTTWTLPDIANGKAPVRLARTEDGRLFLFNQPGRVLRIKPTPGAAQPFTIEATFAKNIPSVDEPTRIWLDPAGRIIIAYEKRLAILFPSGFIPPRLKDLMVTPEGAEDNP